MRQQEAEAPSCFDLMSIARELSGTETMVPEARSKQSPGSRIGLRPARRFGCLLLVPMVSAVFAKQSAMVG